MQAPQTLIQIDAQASLTPNFTAALLFLKHSYSYFLHQKQLIFSSVDDHNRCEQ